MEDYLLAQPEKHLEKIEAWIRYLAEQGTNLRRPYADVVQGPIRELRVGLGRMEHRILHYFPQRDAVVLLHAFTKKTNAVPAKELDTAWS